jgi:pilus assembly protein CpaF
VSQVLPSANRAVRAETVQPALVNRAAERALREEVGAAASQLLDERQLVAPGPAEEAQIRSLIGEAVARWQRRAVTLNTAPLVDPDAVAQRLFDGLLRLGRLQPYLEAPGVEEIMVNGPNRVWILQDGHMRLVPDVVFDNDDEVLGLVKRILGPAGRRLDETSPWVDVILPDGSRLNAVIPPATTIGTCLTIRKFTLRAQSLEQLVLLGTLPDEAARFLDACVQAGINLLISGQTGAGKTTVLNCLGAAIPSEDERIVTIEDDPELQLYRQIPHCIPLVARKGNAEGAGRITTRELVRNALRMRPTRIIVGECRGPESLDMLLAMSSGHSGSMTTIHADRPRDALTRLITYAMMAEERVPRDALQDMVASTVELVVQLRYEARTGRRRVASIYEVAGVDANHGTPTLTGNELWALDTRSDRLLWTGIQPRCLAKLASKGASYALPLPSRDREA